MFLAQSLASLLDVSTGLTGGGIWWAERERLEGMQKAVVWLLCDEMITRPRTPAA